MIEMLLAELAKAKLKDSVDPPEFRVRLGPHIYAAKV